MRQKILAISVVSLLACLAGTTVFGVTSNSYSPNSVAGPIGDLQEFKLHVNANLWGYSGDNTFSEGQVRVPLFGDSSKVLYGLVDGDAAVNNDSWLAGGGIGYRQVVDNKRIFGGYALFDYANTNYNNSFWVVNPGLEMLGQVWDIDINGFIPLGNKKKMGQELWADDLLNDSSINARDYIRFMLHDEFAHKFRLTEEAGYGLSAEIGRTVPYIDRAKIYVGGYHLDTKDMGSTNGAQARLTFDINKRAAFELKNTYDDVYHNRTSLGVKLTFGSYDKEQKQNLGISSRLMDPVDNNFARLNAGRGVFSKIKYTDLGEFHRHDNIWFFKHDPQKSSYGDGTYENPFNDFNITNYNKITNIGVIDPYSLMYFTYGQYDFSSFMIDGRFPLPKGWGMYGRTDDYKAPAIGNNRAQFKGGIDLDYGNEPGLGVSNTLDSINFADTVDEYTLYANNAFLILKNVVISSNVNNIGSTAIYSVGSNITFASGDNDINAIGNGEEVYGINSSNSTLNFIGGNNIITAINNGDGDGAYVSGIVVRGTTLNFSGGNNIIQAINNGDGGSDPTKVIFETTIGIDSGWNGGGSNIYFNGGNNTITATNVGNGNGVYVSGIAAVRTALNFSGGNNTINATNKGYGVNDKTIGIDSGWNGGGSNIYFSGGNNTITATNDGDGSDDYVSDIAVRGSTLSFSGGYNFITVTNNGSSAGDTIISIDSSDKGRSSNISFSGGNNIITATNNGDGDGAYISGITLGGSTLSFSGGNNTIQAINNGDGGGDPTNDVFETTIGIDSGWYGGSSNISFSSGNNTIKVINNGDGDGIYFSDIVVYSSSLSFSGGNNTITVTKNGNGAGDTTIGIDSGEKGRDSNISFSGGNTQISILNNSTDGQSYAYGIYAKNNSYIDFTNTNQKVVVEVNGTSNQYGIYADNSSYISSNQVSISLPNDLLQYVTFKTDNPLAPSPSIAAYWDGQSGWIINW